MWSLDLAPPLGANPNCHISLFVFESHPATFALACGLVPGGDLLCDVGIEGVQAGHLAVKSAVLLAQTGFKRTSTVVDLGLFGCVAAGVIL